jgi:hypothetical protein
MSQTTCVIKRPGYSLERNAWLQLPCLVHQHCSVQHSLSGSVPCQLTCNTYP